MIVTNAAFSVVMLFARVVQFPVIPGDTLVVPRFLLGPDPTPSSSSGSEMITELVPVAPTIIFSPSYAYLSSVPPSPSSVTTIGHV